jgi:hypothetical protein
MIAFLNVNFLHGGYTKDCKTKILQKLTYKLLILLVAGAGFEPTTFGL